MLLGEPTPTQADLHFRLFGFPVRVHPLFWLVAILLTVSRKGGADPVDTLVWVAVVFVSILVHELGHAFLQRNFGGHPRITLYSFGGLASCNDCDRSPRKQISILLGGPFAGFMLAAFVVLAMKSTGHVIGFASSKQTIDLESMGLESALIQPLGPFLAYFEPVASNQLNNVIGDLLQVNIMWGLVNLLPIFPLDGGQISRELFSLRNSRSGTFQSLQLSAGVAVLVAAYALLNQRMFTGIMFGLLAYENFQSIQFYRSHWR
jgi:Zn-dependent protease